MNPAAPNPITSLIPIAAIFLIFYFLLIRPQQKQAQEHEKMLKALNKGDRVLTNGGIYGVIVGFKGHDLELEIAKSVKVLVSRASVSRLAADESAPAPAAQGVGAAS